MKSVQHEIVRSEQDAMGRRTQVKISIPLNEPNSVEELRCALSDLQSELSLAFQDILEYQERCFPGNILEAYQWANEVADEDAEPLSGPYEMLVVSRGLEQALDFLAAAPNELKHEFEQALSIAFTAGSNFRLAVSRKRHLADLTRELAQAKGRDRARAENVRSRAEDNQFLFEYMEPRLRDSKNKELTVARWAAQNGYGAQTGDIEKDARANRSRYKRWLSSKAKK